MAEQWLQSSCVLPCFYPHCPPLLVMLLDPLTIDINGRQWHGDGREVGAEQWQSSHVPQVLVSVLVVPLGPFAVGIITSWWSDGDIAGA